MATALMVIGVVLTLVGTIWIIVIAFQNGDVLWGIVSIFCGLACLIYGIMNFDQAKTPLGLWVLGIILSVVGSAMGGGGA